MITYEYDVTFHRLEKQRVTTLGTGVDSTVQSIKAAWDPLGRVEQVTSCSDNNCSVVVNEVVYEYNDFGALSKEYQEHEGAKDNDTLYVQYNYDTTASGGAFTKAYRPKSVRYPNARLVHYTYGAADSVADKLSRLDAIKNDNGGSPGATSYAAYSWNGVGRMVVEDFTQPDVRLDYWGQTADTYAGFDRFGRVRGQLWRDYGAPADRDKYTYGHDRNSNRLYRENTVTTDKDELYAYDRLNRLTTLHRGDLDNDKDEIPVADRVKGEAWGLSPVGNWDDYQVDRDGDGDFTGADELDQDRTHNDANEVTDITEQPDPQQAQWATPVWSARGNMTTAPRPADLTATLTCTYDSWNRLVEAKDGATTILKNEYDGTNRRIKKHIDSEAPGSPNGVDVYGHFFYDVAWQIVETRISDTENTGAESLDTETQYVWSVRYIDAPVLRDRDADDDSETGDLGFSGSGLEERIYYTTDANMNVTSILDTGGDALERYIYDAYGTPTVLDADWSADADDVSDYSNNILFAGYYYDWETGLYHVRNRMYHAPLGRWMQRDPLGYVDGMNLYEYVASSPIVRTDPAGLDWTEPQLRVELVRVYGTNAKFTLLYAEKHGYAISQYDFWFADYDIQGKKILIDEDLSVKAAAAALKKALDEWHGEIRRPDIPPAGVTVDDVALICCQSEFRNCERSAKLGAMAIMGELLIYGAGEAGALGGAFAYSFKGTNRLVGGTLVVAGAAATSVTVYAAVTCKQAYYTAHYNGCYDAYQYCILKTTQRNRSMIPEEFRGPKKN